MLTRLLVNRLLVNIAFMNIWVHLTFVLVHLRKKVRHTSATSAKYKDPVRNYGTLSSFYQMIVITFINFTILSLAFYLD